MFVLLPTARVSRTAAAAGSLVSAILWVLGKELFGAVIFALYAQGTAAKIFGSSLFVVLAFLFWLWLTWIIVLFIPVHVYLSFRADVMDREGEMSSIFSGGRFVRADVVWEDE